MKNILKNVFKNLFLFFGPFILIPVILGGILIGLSGLWLYFAIPTEKEIRGCMITKMRSVDLCPGSSKYVRLSQISPNVIKALIMTEDASFYSHNGFDFDEIKKSFEKNMKLGRYARGASTITQQLTRNLFLTEEKNLTRKFKEVVFTIQVENVLKKSEILERYLNVVEFGPNIYGIAKASDAYFKKPPSQLSLLESSFLVFLLPNPKVYSQSYFKSKLTSFAEKRLRQILGNLFRVNKVDEEEYHMALSQLESFPNRVNPGLTPPEKYLDEEMAQDLTEDGVDDAEVDNTGVSIIEESQ